MSKAKSRVFENKILSTIYRGIQDENSEEWRQRLNDRAHDLYSKTDMVRILKSHRLKWAGHIVRMLEGRTTFRIFKSQSFDRRRVSRKRWVGNINRDVQAGCE